MRKALCAFAWILWHSPALSFSVARSLGQNNKAALHPATRRMLTRRAASAAGIEPPPRPASPAGDNDPTGTAELVTELLDKIEGTNRGIDCTCSERDSIDRIIEQLNTSGENKEWLKDPKVFGNYNVAYVSSGSSERSNPAGGRWRGRVGRRLFRTEDMFQHLVEPSTAVNMIFFRALGLLKGCVTLRGDFEAMPDRKNFVEASFGPPLINFLGGRGLTIQSGPKSSVKLAATYVDDRIRLGKGGRGSLFVFTRGGPAESPRADEWKVYSAAGARPTKARVLGAAAACGAVAAAARSAFVPAVVLASMALGLVTTQGGVVRGSTDPDQAGSETAAA